MPTIVYPRPEHEWNVSATMRRHRQSRPTAIVVFVHGVATAHREASAEATASPPKCAQI